MTVNRHALFDRLPGRARFPPFAAGLIVVISSIEFIMNTLLKVRNLMVALVVATVVLSVPLSAQAKAKSDTKICIGICNMH